MATHYCLALQAERGRHPPKEEIIMNAETNPYATHEPLDDEERELMDPDSWDWDSATPGRTIGTPGAQLRVHFTRQELHELVRIASQAGIGPVELVRRTALERIAAEATR
jgi:hypothetical protein